MPYCWIKRRGATWYLHFSKSLSLKPESLRTKDKALAREIQRRRESDLFCGAQGIEKKLPEKIRYSELLEKYIAHKRASGLAPKSVTNYLKLLNHFGEFLQRDLPLLQIDTELIEGFIAKRRDLGKAPKTIRNEFFTLVNLFSWALERNYVASDPIRHVAKPKRVVYDAPRYLTFDEYLALKAKIKNPVFADYVDFYLLSGLRRADGLNVTSENFDFERMIATLPQHKQGTTKKLPISPDLYAVVKRMIDRVGKGKPLVKMHVSRLTGNFAVARDLAELPKSITWHSLRHTFATWLGEAGVDIKMIQELIGHKSAESTQIYLHAFNPNKRAAIEKLHLPKAANAG